MTKQLKAKVLDEVELFRKLAMLMTVMFGISILYRMLNNYIPMTINGDTQYFNYINTQLIGYYNAFIYPLSGFILIAVSIFISVLSIFKDSNKLYRLSEGVTLAALVCQIIIIDQFKGMAITSMYDLMALDEIMCIFLVGQVFLHSAIIRYKNSTITNK